MSKEPGRVLIVDDNSTMRFLLYRGVQQLGHIATVAESGREALQILEDQEIDAILLDIMMPEMSGYAVLEQLKNDADLRDIPVIVISGEDDMENIARSIELGAEDFLPKPFSPVILRARLNTSLEKKRFRDLERAYLNQEIMLRQSERIASLARLSAGMAHELNNSVAAASRESGQIPERMDLVQQFQLTIGKRQLTADQASRLSDLDSRAKTLAKKPLSLGPLELSDREQEIQQVLSSIGMERSWEQAAQLAGFGWTQEDVTALSDELDDDSRCAAIEWLVGTSGLYAAARDIHGSLERIGGIVEALKAYSYMDQAPYQSIDIHEALENTLAVLEPAVPEGIHVRREFAQTLPRIEGYGSELSMVWTNIIENAVDALDDQGEIVIRTCPEDDWAVVEFQDNGPGIATEDQSKIFDPFFTTKPPGQGVGLGLSVSHTIVVRKLGGQLRVQSEPGCTVFVVRLPSSGSGQSGNMAE